MKDHGSNVTTGGRTAARRHFVTHLIEMVVAMVAGMMLLAPVWSALWPNLDENPAADAMVMAVNMAIGMGLWMWVRGHGWQMVAEMSVAMVAPFALLLIPHGLGVLSDDGLMTFGHVGMVIAMLGAMVLRLGAYTHTHPWRLAIRQRT